jgi:hypothetical protein
MAIILKNSTTAGKSPTAAQLVAGELAANSADGVLYTKKGSNVVRFVDDLTSKTNPILTGIVTVAGQMVVVNQVDIKLSLTASTATTELELTAASVFKVLIAANTAITFKNPPTPHGGVLSFSVITANDATAGRAVAWPTNVKWSGGILPTRTTAANAIDTWTFYSEDDGLTWVGSLASEDAK